ncbi:GFA family protein [Altererythrobacter xixiisoli]|uniref:GFA family protein n=1 Tax=Croceibacterium xixiisoli TaxID=1476466 RepID=A0A6I4TW87_9SPHN|nr:GFA family protein [Croceibacterium xixiisoli]MXP00255.1 GFA family protein [Croceibacterium xixiisoli]
MTDSVTASGQCLCGAVQFTAELANQETGACHCSMCRQWSGGVFLSVEAKSVTLDQADRLTVYTSSEWAERCFCADCGSSLLWRTKDQSHYAVSVQALENGCAFPLTTQIFIDEKPAGYNFREKTADMTGAEVFAAFASE